MKQNTELQNKAIEWWSKFRLFDQTLLIKRYNISLPDSDKSITEITVQEVIDIYLQELSPTEPQPIEWWEIQARQCENVLKVAENKIKELEKPKVSSSESISLDNFIKENYGGKSLDMIEGILIGAEWQREQLLPILSELLEALKEINGMCADAGRTENGKLDSYKVAHASKAAIDKANTILNK